VYLLYTHSALAGAETAVRSAAADLACEVRTRSALPFPSCVASPPQRKPCRMAPSPGHPAPACMVRGIVRRVRRRGRGEGRAGREAECPVVNSLVLRRAWHFPHAPAAGLQLLASEQAAARALLDFATA